MLSDQDRELVEAIDPMESPQECGYYYEDEVPEGISAEGWDFLMDLCRYRIVAASAQQYPPGWNPYQSAWDDALRASLRWPGFDREPPSDFRFPGAE